MRYIKQVKVLQGGNVGKLTERVNEFLEQVPYEDILEIKSMDTMGTHIVSILVVYRERVKT